MAYPPPVCCHNHVTTARIDAMSKMVRQVQEREKRLSRGKIKARKIQLRRLYKIVKTWRRMQEEYYPEIGYQVLNRFVNEPDYIPAGRDERKALDLYMDDNPYRVLPRWYKRIPESLVYFNAVRDRIKSMYEDAKKSRMNEIS